MDKKYDNAYSAILDIMTKANGLSTEYIETLKAYPCFPRGYVFDKKKSQSWNEEEGKRRASARKKIEDEWEQKKAEYWQEAENVIRAYIMSEYGFSEEITALVCSWAGKPFLNGYLAVLGNAHDIGEKVRKVIDLYEQERK